MRRDTTNAGAGVLMYKPDVLHLVYKQRKAHTHASWYCRERESLSDVEKKKLLNKVIIFFFLAHKCILVAS